MRLSFPASLTGSPARRKASTRAPGGRPGSGAVPIGEVEFAGPTLRSPHARADGGRSRGDDRGSTTQRHLGPADPFDSAYCNPDLAPTAPSERRWGLKDFAVLWISMS